MLCLNLTDIAFITVKGVDCCAIPGITKSDPIHFSLLGLMIVGIWKTSIKRINIKNRV